jgi:8-oxo-dGTP pyrophosphatase MutT (NUDIX family)
VTDEEKDLKNGSNLIVVQEDGSILVERERTRLQQWMLPGGGIDRGESPRHAAQAETEEETGIITDEATYRLIGFFIQKPKGVVFLYETTVFSGSLITEPNEEVSEARFMGLREIIERKAEFRTAYLRMILRYIRCKYRVDPIPYEGRLSDIVEFSRNLLELEYDLEEHERFVLSV